MIIFCSKCGINWAALHQQDDYVNDESYEYCPKCKTDSFLANATDIVAFLMCPFSGLIYNVDTKEPYCSTQFSMQQIEKSKVYDESLEDYMLRKQQIEDSTPLNIQVPKIDRKHHFEFI